MEAVLEKQPGYKNRIMLAAQCLISLGLIIRCNSMWITLEGIEDTAKKISYALVFLGILAAVLVSGALKDTRKLVLSVAFTGVFAMYLMVTLFITNFAHELFLRDAIAFLALLLFYLLVEGTEQIPGILLCYEKVVTVIAVLSVVCWVVFTVIRPLPYSGIAMTWWNGTDHYTPVGSFYGIYYEPQYMYVFDYFVIRNCSFFTEAPMAAMHFGFAFLINLFLEKRTSKLRAVLLAIAIGTTFSATGLVIIALSLILKMLIALFRSARYRNLSKNQKTAVKCVIILLSIALVTGCVLLIRGRVGGLSWRIRVQDARATFLAWLDRPVFGNGMYNFDAVKMHFPADRAAEPGFSCTTSLGTILADGGLLFGFLYIGSFVCCLIKAFRNREYHVAAFAALVFLIFTVTIVSYDYIVLLMFIFFGAYRCKSYRYLQGRIMQPEAE